MPDAPSSITIQVNVDSKHLRESVSALIAKYSEWLEEEGLLSDADYQDHRTHDDLVAEFFKGEDDEEE